MRPVLLVVQKNDHSLGYYSIPDGEPLHRVPLDPYPHEFAVSPDGCHAFICHFGVALAEDEGPGGHTVSVVDVRAVRRSGTFDCAPDRRPHGITLDQQGRLYVLSEGSSRLLVASDPASGAFDRRLSCEGEGSHWVTVTRNGELACISNMATDTVSLLQPWSDRPKPLSIEVGERPEGSVLSSDERKLYVACREGREIAVIDMVDRRRTGSIATPPGPVRVCRGPSGKLFAAFYHAASVALIDGESGRFEASVDLPDKAVSISYDAGRGLIAVSLVSDEVCLIDQERWRISARIGTRPGPDPTCVVCLPAA